jgi:hypothetical protein
VRTELEHSLALMQRQLGAEPARRAWQDGTALSLDDAIRLAAHHAGPAS